MDVEAAAPLAWKEQLGAVAVQRGDLLRGQLADHAIAEDGRWFAEQIAEFSIVTGWTLCWSR
jgi:hypothetical protein